MIFIQKILIHVTNEALYFSYKNPDEATTDLNKTNIINDSELVFSRQYILDNQKLVSLFIKEICHDKKLYRVTIETNELAIFLMDFFKKNSLITAICIRESAPLSFLLYEKLIENKNITYIEAESIPEFMVEMLDQKGIRSESRTEVFYPSYFMQSNNLVSFSKIFYKMNIRIDTILTEEDRDDFLAFCDINKYLKTIHLNLFDKSDLEYILETLEVKKIKNIRVLIYENIKDYKIVEYLKKLNKKVRKNKYQIELVYSKEYLKNNIFKQIISNTLKICGLILVMLVVSIISYISISNYVSLQQVTQIQETIKETISDPNPPAVTLPNENEKVIKNNYLVSLLSINPDVVGWIKVNNTEVDYSVVQAPDNDYYLSHNIENKEDKNGWIFMDYRNSSANLDANTIIYGHNMYYSKVMFGTLADAYKKSWYTNPENLKISFDTIYESNEYEIFSIYKIPKTKDYLKTYFADANEFNEYVNLVTGRSIHDFGIDVKHGDKILTLSTCSNNNERLVIHAKLIKPESD